jgi:hypothetical protein
MNLKRRCCCPGEPLELVRYVEVVPVISIPASSYMYANTKFFLDLGEDLELTSDLLLYEGGAASTGGAPVRWGYFSTFVPDSSGFSVRFADGTISGSNMDNIGALRHRGWRVKGNGLRFSFAQWVLGDFSDMTRIEMNLPGTAGTLSDPVNQVQDGGYYFLAGEFSSTPALVTQRTTVDQNGNEANYLLGYNPRRECSKPEQGRTYGSNPRLIFDFTSEFPGTITLTFRYRYRATASSSSEVQEITKSYQKFVAGSATYQTTESLPRSGGFGNYRNVNGYVTEDPSDSDYILFGYRAVNCTEERTDSDGDYVYVSAPSMPVKYYSFGSTTIFRHSAQGVIKFASGDGGQGLQNVFTDESFTQFQDASNWIPHQTAFGAVTSDVTYGPDNPPLEDDTELSQLFSVGSSEPFLNGGTSAMSYKGPTELRSIHTFSLESAWLVFPRVRRKTNEPPESGVPSNITLVNVVNNGLGLGTIDFPLVALDSKNGVVSLQSMSFPLGNPYHYLTDGLSSGSFFNQLHAVPNISEG